MGGTLRRRPDDTRAVAVPKIDYIVTTCGEPVRPCIVTAAARVSVAIDNRSIPAMGA